LLSVIVICFKNPRKLHSGAAACGPRSQDRARASVSPVTSQHLSAGLAAYQSRGADASLMSDRLWQQTPETLGICSPGLQIAEHPKTGSVCQCRPQDLERANIVWPAGEALRTTLTDAGQDGWGAAATASSAALGALFLLTDSSRLYGGDAQRAEMPFPSRTCPQRSWRQEGELAQGAHSVPPFRRVHVRTAFLGQALEVRLEGRALAAGV
jgi:hypothetical protein